MNPSDHFVNNTWDDATSSASKLVKLPIPPNPKDIGPGIDSTNRDFDGLFTLHP